MSIEADGIRMAVFALSSSDTPQLLDSGFAEFAGDISAELPQDAVVAMTLKRLMDGRKPGTKRTRIAIEGSAVFSRLVKLPMVGSDQLEKTIRHEAVQNIPFPIDEVVWDAHVIDPDVPEPEVLLVAVKAELVEGLVHAVKANGLAIEKISVAPVALANAVRAVEKTDSSMLLVDAGTESSNLVFIDGARTFFRTLPMVGSVKDRLVKEIERSITFYRSQQQGRAPERVLAERSLAESLGDRLSLPVDASTGSVCMGLAVDQAVAINLVPVSLQHEQELKRRLPLWIAAAVMLVLLLAVWILNLNLQLAETRTVMGSVEKQVRELSRIEQQLLPLEEQVDGLNRRAAVYDDVLANRTFWLETLEELNRLLPEGMFLLATEPLLPNEPLNGIRISVVSYLDKEPDGQDVVRSLRDSLRASERFSEKTTVFSRPSKKLFAREFVMDVYFAEDQL
ncbi:pilus assembly protein PilM [Pontiellaceae bacterium B1224]|nr:pilus assembly protein PilM [Pontiellaceae bacterium B1224]